MNNIDKILKEALNGYEAPFDSAMWDKVSSQLSPMEDALRNSLENHEAPYNPKAWDAIKNKIGSSWTLTQWITGSAAAIALIATAIVFWPTTDQSIQNEDANLALSADTTHEDANQTITDNTTANLVSTETETQDENHIVTPATKPVEQSNTDADTPLTPNHPQTNNTGSVFKNFDSNEGPTDSIKHDLKDPYDEDNHLKNTPTLALTADFKASAYSVCEGTTIILNPKISKVGTNHTWEFGDGMVSNETNATHNYLSAGTFIITHTIRESSSNKVLASDQQSIEVNKIPSVDFGWNQFIENVPAIDFQYNGSSSSQVLWSVDGNVVSDQLKFQQTFREKGEHVIKLTVSNAEGCSNSALEKIEIENDYNLFAPTAFTPNGDNNNDQFIPVALTLLNNDFKLFVYDIEGHLVYQTANANTPWDGRDIRTQTEAEAGVYVWFVTLINENGLEEIYRGQVLLVR